MWLYVVYIWLHMNLFQLQSESFPFLVLFLGAF